MLVRELQLLGIHEAIIRWIRSFDRSSAASKTVEGSHKERN